MSATTPTSAARAERLVETLNERDLHALLVTDLVNVRWLTGFTGTNGAAVVGTDGTLRFVTDFRYLTQAAEQLAEPWTREISIRCSRASSSSSPTRASCASASTTST
jgi:Xaa-Pro aminopeptidase